MNREIIGSKLYIIFSIINFIKIRQNIFHAARLEHQRNTITNQRNFCATDMPMTNQYQFLGLYPWATDVDINKVYDKYIATVKPNKSDAREIYKFTQMKTV